MWQRWEDCSTTFSKCITEFPQFQLCSSRGLPRGGQKGQLPEPSPEKPLQSVQVFAGGLKFQNLTNDPLTDIISYFNLGACNFVWGAMLSKVPPR